MASDLHDLRLLLAEVRRARKRLMERIRRIKEKPRLTSAAYDEIRESARAMRKRSQALRAVSQGRRRVH